MTFTAALRTANAAIKSRAAHRSISIGTDMLSSMISLQKPRPWFMCAEEGSNKAKDNAVTLAELFGRDKTVAVFGVPAPFTGTCTHEHIPGYEALAAEIRQAGADELVCVTVSDPYALHGWQTAMGTTDDRISFLADPDASFARAYGVDKRYDECSLGLRSERFSMIVHNGEVANFRIVDDAAKDAEQLLEELKELKENQSEIARSA